jgi:hypothetical protein
MTIEERAKKLFIALEANTDGRKAAMGVIRRELSDLVEACATVADKRAEIEANWAKEWANRLVAGDSVEVARKIGEEIRALKEGK